MRILPSVLLGVWVAGCGSGAGGPGGGTGTVAPPKTIHREDTRIVAPWAGIDAAGVGYVVWSNDANVAFLSRFIPGEGWTPTETIPGTVRLDSLAVDEAGVLHAADDSSSATQIALWSYQAAAGWQALTPLSTARGGAAQLLPAGRGVSVVWVHAETTLLKEIWGARYHPDSGWSVPAVVSHAPQTMRDIGTVTAAADPDGNVAVMWNEDTSDSSALMAANLPVGGSWSAPHVLLTPAATFSGDLAMGAGGRALAAWEDQQMLNASWLDPQAGWAAPAPAIAGVLKQMNVSVDDGGRALVSWMELSDDPTARLLGFEVLRGAAYDSGSWTAAPVTDRHPDRPDLAGSLSVFYATSTLVGSQGRGAIAATSSSGREMYLLPYRHGAGASTARVVDVTDRVLEEQNLPVADGVTVGFGRPYLVANRAGQAIMIWTMLRSGGPGVLRVTAFDL